MGLSRATPLGREHREGSGWQLGPKLTHSSFCSDLTVDSTEMTALFLVILTDQCREKKNHFPALTGGIASVAAWLLLGRKLMLIPAMAAMIVIFIFSRKFSLSAKEAEK